MSAGATGISAGSTVRPLRKDAADNRERLLAAAAIVFARDGIGAGVEAVAREAGVGMGTMYRRFPTKQALIDELVDTLLDDMISAAQAALGAEDGTGVERYLRAVGAMLAQRRDFVPMVWRARRRSSGVAELRRITAELLARAQDRETISSTVTITDITAAIWSMRGVMETTHAVAPDAWRRHLDFLLAGMRARDIDFSAPPIGLQQLDQIATAAD